MKKTKKITMLILLTMLLVGVFGTTASARSSTVATIGSKNYTSLEAALKKVKNGQTIVLKKNLTYKKQIKVNRNVKFTLNLNKKSITFPKGAKDSACICIYKGTVTVKNGKVTNKNYSTNGFTFEVVKGAKLIVSSGTYSGTIGNDGTISIKGGTFKTSGYFTIANYGTLSITGGTFNQTHKFDSKKGESANGAILVNFDAARKVTINGGTFTSNALIIASDTGRINIKKGTFTSKNAGNLYLGGSAKVTVTGGTWTVKNDWGAAYVHDKAALTIQGGTFKSQWSLLETYDDTAVIKITGGKFTTTTSNVPMIVCFNGKTTLTGGTFTGKKTWGYWIDPANASTSKVKISGAKFTVNAKKGTQKTGELFD